MSWVIQASCYQSNLRKGHLVSTRIWILGRHLHLQLMTRWTCLPLPCNEDLIFQAPHFLVGVSYLSHLISIILFETSHVRVISSIRQFIHSSDDKCIHSGLVQFLNTGQYIISPEGRMGVRRYF